MDYLWTPWRYQYVATLDKKKDDRCVFCDALAANDDARALIVFRGGKNFVILNQYPYTTGHSMVVPYAHEAELGPHGLEIGAHEEAGAVRLADDRRQGAQLTGASVSGMRPLLSRVVLRSQSDERLVTLAREGHDQAFVALAERYRRELLAHARSIVAGDRGEDAVQQAMLSAWSALRGGAAAVRGPGPVAPGSG